MSYRSEIPPREAIASAGRCGLVWPCYHLGTMVAGIRRAAFAFALLTTAAGAAPRASAQSSLSRPGRSGSGAILWFARAFPNLDMELYAESGQAQGVRVSVMVYWAKDAKDHCFLAPADLRVGFGGKAMRLARQGHPYGPTSISGVSFQLSNCAPGAGSGR